MTEHSAEPTIAYIDMNKFYAYSETILRLHNGIKFYICILAVTLLVFTHLFVQLISGFLCCRQSSYSR